ncbi:D-alanyl-D-alanine carboxypeptidase [Streptomyces coeruleofuscus]|uniref:serine-type D-Ala-D-Ala carboxypeptidase n=1 Tax=Streptomyces coeruleofuscus TaxID=66879 RepID=A0ABN3IKU4_9ACTN
MVRTAPGSGVTGGGSRFGTRTRVVRREEEASVAGESPDRSKQRESSAEPTSGSASPVPEARSEAAPKRDPRLAVARDTERSAKRGGADTATRVLSTRTAEKPGEAADTERDTGEAGSTADAEREADAERGEGRAGAEGTVADAEQGSDEADSAADAEQDADDTRAEGAAADAEQGEDDAGAEGPAAGAKRDPRETDPATDTEQDADDTDSAAGAEQDAGEPDSAADAEQGESDAGAEGTAAGAKRDPRETDPATDTEQDADDTDSAADAEQGESDAGAEGTAVGASQRSAEEAVKDSGESTGSGERGDDTASSDGRLRDAVAAWVASADQDEEPAAAEGADKGSEGGQEAAERAEGATEADTDGQKPEKAAEADVDARDDQGAEGADEAATDVEDRPRTEGTDNAATDVQDRPKTEGTDNAATDVQDRPKAEAAEAGAGAQDGQEEADEPEADRSATGASEGASADTTASDDTDDIPEKPETAKADGADKAPESDDTDTDEGDTEPPVDQPTAVFKAVRPPVDQPTTMLKLGGAAKEAKDAKAAPEKDAERTSKFVALKPLDDPAARKPASTPAPAEATAPVPTVGPERTTQQPLPPRPPLDLLAELTNTPPPPDTPLRTAVRRVKIWTPLVLLLVIVFGVVQSVRPLPAPTLELTAEDSYTFEGGEVDIPWPAKGQAALDVQGIGTFGSSGEQKPVPIASVAKVMTAYVILRDHPLKSGADGPKIEIDQAAEDQSDAGQESTVDVTKGDKISQREALESILIASANNVARLLARWDAGSEKAFVGKMNDAAKDLGMKNTTYTDPSGLNNTTVSTAVDQVKLAKAAMEQPAFREVAAMMSYVDYKGTKHDNWNRLVGYNDVTGIKTGTTTSALGNLVFSARKDVNGETRRIVGAVVRQPAGGPDNTILGAALHEGDKLIKAAQGALESATILKKGSVVGYADDGLGGRTPVAVTEDVTAVGWAGLSVKLTFAADELPHTAKAGKKVGTLTVGDGSTNAVKVPVALQEDLVEPGFADKLTRIG